MIGKPNNLNSKEIEIFSVSKNDDIQYFFSTLFFDERKISKFIESLKALKRKYN